MIYSNAFDATGKIQENSIITEEQFNYLQVDFAKRYLESIRFKDRLSLHRNPPTVMQEILNELYPYFQVIQQRKEMIDIDPMKNSVSYAVSKVADIWKENKLHRSLYKAVLAYCELRGKDPNIIATHIAEYKSLTRLARQLEIRVGKTRQKIKPITPDQRVKNEPRAITDVDKLIRELDIIQNIFQAQVEKANFSAPFVYPEVLDASGKERANGICYNWIDIFSEHEMFPIQHYKQVFTARYESTTNPELIKNQLVKIYEKAKYSRDFYNGNLIGEKHIEKISGDFLSINSIADLDEQEKLLHSHNAVVTICDYNINTIYQGTNRHSIGNFIKRDKYSYNYMINNYELARVCQHVMDFIELFGLHLSTKKLNTKEPNIKPVPFTSFQEVFNNNEVYNTAIQALQHLNGIDQSLKNISGPKLKGMIQVMILILKKKNCLKHVSDKDLTVLLNSTFEGLKLGESTDGRTLRNVGKKAIQLYKQKFEQLLP